MHLWCFTSTVQEIGYTIEAEFPPSAVQPEFYGMVPMDGSGKLAGVQRLTVRWPPRLKQVAAVCNSLNLIGRNQVVGDLADKQAFKAVEARFQVLTPHIA